MSRNRILENSKHFLLKHKIILIISCLYFLIRIIYLTRLPIFNDEAIYLDWGWRMTHGNFVWDYSLGDAKPELMMWLFGLFGNIFTDPLFAGRLVSVISGFLTLIGIYRIGQKFFSSKIGILASFLYIVIPIFSFYDRQALMESATATVGVWSAYYAILLLTNPRLRYALFLGMIYGIGFFIKPNAALFLVSYLLIAFLFFLKYHKRSAILINSGIVLCVFGVTDVLLFTDTEFWHTLSSNSRYSLTPKELIAFPLGHWASNILANLEISFYYLTPIVLLTGIIGCILFFQHSKDYKTKLLLLLLVIPIILETVATRSPSQRYLVAYLPLFCVFSAYAVVFLFHAKKRFGVTSSIVLLCIPGLITVIQVLSPISYFSLMDKITRFSDKYEYVSGMTGGYGLDDVTTKLESFGRGRNIVIGTGINTGNPESALRVWAIKKPAMQVAYLDASLLGTSLQGINCLRTFPPDLSVYYVSRDDQQHGLNKYLQKISEIKNPYGTNHFGLYKLNNDCKGISLPIDFQTGSARVLQIQAPQVQSGSQPAQAQTNQMQIPQGWKSFENPAMNLQFAYPQELMLAQDTPTQVSLANPVHPDSKEKLLIYSMQDSSGNETLEQIPLPFDVTGSLVKSWSQPLNGFQGLMKAYSDNTDLTQVLFLQQGTQVFVIRFPEHKALDPSVVNSIVMSIKILR